MMSLPVFLLARLDEDEAAAKAATEGPWTWHVASDLHEDAAGWVGAPGRTPSGVFVASVSNTLDGLDDGPHIARHSPARVLADVEAKRCIVENCAPGLGEGDYFAGQDFLYDQVLRLLALPYADHPDYRAEWKP